MVVVWLTANRGPLKVRFSPVLKRFLIHQNLFLAGLIYFSDGIQMIHGFDSTVLDTSYQFGSFLWDDIEFHHEIIMKKPSKQKPTILVFPKIGVPQNGWFIMENPIKMADLGVPLFSETPILHKANDFWIWTQNPLHSHRFRFARMAISAWSRPFEIPLRRPSTKASLACSWSPASTEMAQQKSLDHSCLQNLFKNLNQKRWSDDVELELVVGWWFSAYASRPVNPNFRLKLSTGFRWLEIGRLNVTKSEKHVLTNSQTHLLRYFYQQTKLLGIVVWLVVEPPIWKICSSNWKSSPRFGVNIKKIFELPPPSCCNFRNCIGFVVQHNPPFCRTFARSNLKVLCCARSCNSWPLEGRNSTGNP